MALHTGAAELREGDYFGPPLNRVARLLAVGHGGQVLLSETNRGLVRDDLPPGAGLLDLGSHRLRDLQRAERVFQLQHPDLPATFPPLRSLDHLPNNLPRQITSFVGREREIAEVERLLAGTRLLTITGSGGTGKTRLAIQVAADLLRGDGDGVWLAELAPLSEGGQVAYGVATALGVREEPGAPIADTLVGHLQPRRLLLVLDNTEHVLDAAAELVERILRYCPGVSILATSREALNVPGETNYRLRSLSLPDPRQLPALEALTQYEAVKLFIDRAASIDPAFTVTNQNAPALAQVCVRLDGVALAIELAAARVKALSVEKIAERLDDRFRLLTGGARTALPRQQTLRATIDWSYDLLQGEERQLMLRLSVFAGGWSLEAVEAICAFGGIEEWQILDLMTSLVEKSLVLFQDEKGEGRYHLLETVRQYAWDRLASSGTASAVRDRHLHYYHELRNRTSVAQNALLETDYDNLCAALEWCKADEQKADVGLELVTKLTSFWWGQSHINAGYTYLVDFLERALSAPPHLRADALRAAGVLAGLRGEQDQARTFFQQALSIDRELRRLEPAADSLSRLGGICRREGRYDEARDQIEAALALSEEAGDREGLSRATGALANLALDTGDLAAARGHAETSLAAAREILWENQVAMVLCTLGEIHCATEDFLTARGCFAESLSVRVSYRDKWGLPPSLEGLGQASVGLGDLPRAVRLFSASQMLRETFGCPASPHERQQTEQQMGHLRNALGEAVFSALQTEGRGMAVEQVVGYALDHHVG